jgi:serine/threonine-protein kinase HipA
MEKLGPGSNLDTLQALAMIPQDSFPVIVDAGSGAGRQTLALASQLRTPVHAVDTSERHLGTLARYAEEFGMDELVHMHCMDMADIPGCFPAIDLLWSECAAYHIGFPRALETWFHAIRPDGYAVVSELSWLRSQDEVPPAAREYFRSGYPDMRTVDDNLAVARAVGYDVIATHLLSRAAWIDGYYDKLEPLANSLLQHAEQSVRNFAQQTLSGIRIFDSAEGNYGYVFYVLRKPR